MFWKRPAAQDTRSIAGDIHFTGRRSWARSPAGTPLITTVPYVFEAFQQVYRIDGDDRWHRVMRSIARHALNDYKDIPTSATATTCSYTPFPEHSLSVVNANAYRAYLLTNAAIEFSESKYRDAAQRNLNFVLEAQNEDGSWFYARDGKRSFVDHFHTCFVMKALAKIEALTGTGTARAQLNAAWLTTLRICLMKAAYQNRFRELLG